MADKQQPEKTMGPWKWTLCVSLLVCCVDGSASEDKTAKPGDDVTLQCLGTRGAEILLVKWTRPDLKKEKGGYVFFFRENRSYENNQHPSFRGRVKLINSELKDGDCSVILKNVRIDDTGTYECHVGMRNNPDMSVNTISLTVTDSHPDQTAKPGDNVTLQCLGTRGAEILRVKWIRPDLKEEDGYIFFFRENRFQEDYLHPAFHGRVEQINPEKDGDFSVILKNVRINDTGTYKCYVKNSAGSNETEKLVHTINLTVTDSHPGSTGGRTGEGGAKDGGAKEGGAKDGGNTDRNRGLAVGLSVVAVVLVGVVGFLIYRKQRRLREQDSYRPPVQQADGKLVW